MRTASDGIERPGLEAHADLQLEGRVTAVTAAASGKLLGHLERQRDGRAVEKLHVGEAIDELGQASIGRNLVLHGHFEEPFEEVGQTRVVPLIDGLRRDRFADEGGHLSQLLARGIWVPQETEAEGGGQGLCGELAFAANDFAGFGGRVGEVAEQRLNGVHHSG
jgi:hypothetical protein